MTIESLVLAARLVKLLLDAADQPSDGQPDHVGWQQYHPSRLLCCEQRQPQESGSLVRRLLYQHGTVTLAGVRANRLDVV